MPVITGSQPGCTQYTVAIRLLTPASARPNHSYKTLTGLGPGLVPLANNGAVTLADDASPRPAGGVRLREAPMTGKLIVHGDGRVAGPAVIEYNHPFPTPCGSWGSGAMNGVIMHTMVGNLPGTITVFNELNPPDGLGPRSAPVGVRRVPAPDHRLAVRSRLRHALDGRHALGRAHLPRQRHPPRPVGAAGRDPGPRGGLAHPGPTVA